MLLKSWRTSTICVGTNNTCTSQLRRVSMTWRKSFRSLARIALDNTCPSNFKETIWLGT